MMWLVLASAAAAPRELSTEEGPTAPPDVGTGLPVVGGTVAAPGSWPDAVALYSGGGLFACSGVLVFPDVVLTAGHCQYALDHVLVGTTDLRSGGETIEVAEVVGHPDYVSTYDVAVVKLAREVEGIDPTPPALDCIAAEWLADGAAVDVVGFGATDEWASEWTTELHEARTVVTDADCTDLASGCNEEVSPGGELAAGGDGVDSCAGDSGGPLYLDTPDGPHLLGLTSRATVPASTPCGSGGIYVRLDAVAPWVEGVAQHAFRRPDCAGWNRPPAPTAAPLEVDRGRTAATALSAGDPDAGDTHTWSVVEAPALVDAVIEDGTLVVHAPLGASGDDEVVVRVEDDGEPPLAGEVRIPITVRGGGAVEVRGCATVPGGALAGLLALGLRRRR